jgi:hypothetical protein
MNFKLSTKNKKNNVVADIVSRKEEETKGSLCVIFIPQYDWVEEARIEWKQYQHNKGEM